MSLSIYYLILGIIVSYLAGGWKNIIVNLVSQIYGINLIIQMGKKKKLVIRGWEENSTSSIREESDRIAMNTEE